MNLHQDSFYQVTLSTFGVTQTSACLLVCLSPSTPLGLFHTMGLHSPSPYHYASKPYVLHLYFLKTFTSQKAPINCILSFQMTSPVPPNRNHLISLFCMSVRMLPAMTITLYSILNFEQCYNIPQHYCMRYLNPEEQQKKHRHCVTCSQLEFLFFTF